MHFLKLHSFRSSYIVTLLTIVFALSFSCSDDNSSAYDSPEEYCAPESTWEDAWTSNEAEVLELVNEHRRLGANCGSNGDYPPVNELIVDAALQCASRMHSKDMGDRDFFDHTNPDGMGPAERMAAAGFEGGSWGENISMGNATAQGAVDSWMSSDNHCSNIMNGSFTHIGVGYYQAEGGPHLWTQTFAKIN